MSMMLNQVGLFSSGEPPIGELVLFTDRAAYSTLASNISLATSPQPVALRAMVWLPTGTTYQRILNSDSTNAYWSVRAGNVQVRHNGGNVTISAPLLTAETWHEVAVQIDAGAVIAYVDGVYQGAATRVGGSFVIRHLLATNAPTASYRFKIYGLEVGNVDAPNKHKWQNLDNASATTWLDVGTVGGKNAALTGTYTWEVF